MPRRPPELDPDGVKKAAHVFDKIGIAEIALERPQIRVHELRIEVFLAELPKIPRRYTVVSGA